MIPLSPHSLELLLLAGWLAGVLYGGHKVPLMQTHPCTKFNELPTHMPPRQPLLHHSCLTPRLALHAHPTPQAPPSHIEHSGSGRTRNPLPPPPCSSAWAACSTVRTLDPHPRRQASATLVRKRARVAHSSRQAEADNTRHTQSSCSSQMPLPC